MLAKYANSGLLLMIIASLILEGCNKNEPGITQIIDSTQIKSTQIKKKVTVKVLDAHTRSPLSGADVKILESSSGTSNASGIVVFDSVDVGTLLLEASAINYESFRSEMNTMTKDTGSISTAFTYTLLMYKKGASLKGTVFIKHTDSLDLIKPIKDAKVELTMYENFVYPVQVTTTDSNGQYTFKNLPEFTPYSIRVLPYQVNSQTFEPTQDISFIGNIPAGMTYQVPITILAQSPNGTLFLLSGNEGKWDTGKYFSIKFSNPIDVEKVKPNSILLTRNGIPIAIQTRWDDNGAGLSILPYQNGWPKSGILVLNLVGLQDKYGNTLSSQNQSQNVEIRLTQNSTKTEIENVDSLWIVPSRINYLDGVYPIQIGIDYNTPSYTLEWKKVESATDYDVYTREFPTSSWLLAGTVSEDTSIELQFSSPKKYAPLTRAHMVIARNASTVAKFSDAFVLNVKDGLGPIIADNQQIRQIDNSKSFDNRLFTTPRKIDLEFELNLNQEFFNMEPLDTILEPKLSMDLSNVYYNGGYYPYPNPSLDNKPWVSKFMWISGTKANIEVTVDPEVDGRGFTLSVDFSSMTDLAGNKVRGNNGKPILHFNLIN